MGIDELHGWFAERRAANDYEVDLAPLDRLDGWYFEEGTCNIVHRSGRFFSVRGLDVTESGREVDDWQQPIIVQPEHGILGILVKVIGGVPHCLLQAKMEPGNVNLVQLSPTVQATRSNYTRVHGGKPVPYLEHFVAPRSGRVLFDSLQSEQASWFLAKRNRNMIVRIDDNVPLLPDFRWVSFDEIAELLQVDDLVNMDTRTVLSGAVTMPPAPHDDSADTFTDAMARSWQPGGWALHDTAELLSWFTEAKGRCTLDRRLIPLNRVAGWTGRDGVLTHDENRHFTVVGVDVRASNREVAGWSQPMFAPRSPGLIAFLTRRIAGVPHVLVQARIETGAFDRIEMAPTVHCQPGNYQSGFVPGTRQPRFLDGVLATSPERILLDVIHSEEGGRFYHARSRHLLIEAEDAPLDTPPDFVWMTLRQLAGFVRFGSHLNVEARSLVTLLGFASRRRLGHTR